MAGRLLEAIETYAAAVRRAERAGINASLCQTRRDYAEAHEWSGQSRNIPSITSHKGGVQGEGLDPPPRTLGARKKGTHERDH